MSLLTTLGSFKEFKTTYSSESPSIEANTTYVVTEDVVITNHCTLPPNVKLIFAGGKISGNGTLTGNYTQLEAPITQIFGSNITVDGIWEMERAYPQWFGAKNDTTEDRITNGTYVDSADAINKAMKLKHSGEVFLPKGEYVITKTLQVPHGIVLRGELAERRENIDLQGNKLANGDYPLGEDTLLSDLSSLYKLGTVIRPLNTAYSQSSTEPFQTSFENNYTIMINAKKQTIINENGSVEVSYPWIHDYPQGLTTIRDIQFMNYWTKAPSIKGIYCAGGMKLENLAWSGFVQAVATPIDLYSDGKTVVNCLFYAPHLTTPDLFYTQKDEAGNIIWIDNDYYAFDLRGLGDKLYFSRNHICQGSITGCLNLGGANGAEISCNIINDNVLIKGCKGVSFFSNHCENGTQIEVSRSQVNISGNFFHKGAKPTFLFHDLETFRSNSVNTQSSIISLQDNSLIFLDYEKEGEPLYIGNISTADIQTDGWVSLSIQNTYRYQAPRDKIGNTFIFGLTIQKEAWNNAIGAFNLTPFTEFNNLSYLLSTECSIKPKFCINTNHLVKNTQAVGISAQLNDRVQWFIESGEYSYSVQTIWDRKRQIGTEATTLYSSADSTWFECKNKDEVGALGPLFTIHGNTTPNHGNQAILKLVRSYSNTIKAVEIPICGANQLFDNGISIAGFKWGFAQLPTVLPVNTSITSVHFVGDNVICKGTSCPTLGQWTVGDIVYNTGTASTNALWVYTENGWQAR